MLRFVFENNQNEKSDFKSISNVHCMMMLTIPQLITKDRSLLPLEPDENDKTFAVRGYVPLGCCCSVRDLASATGYDFPQLAYSLENKFYVLSPKYKRKER